MASLQEQMLKAGLVSKDTAKRAKKTKQKQSKTDRKNKVPVVDEAKIAAEKERKLQAERDRKLNQQKQREANQKALRAQIKQLIQLNQINRDQSEIAYSFIHDGKVKSIHVTESVRKQLIKGRFAIVMFYQKEQINYEVVPLNVANKIKSRDARFVVQINEPPKDVEETDDDDPYADFKIPEDLMW